ncbi:MCE family protein [[Mycobacterium] wendilense]|uniref:MCE family protein n=1 Tax=[Mycobacterium] wendilense TaxID=3064284 RepID=A0ABN9PAE8_9MYCO|nr:MCE family protein [Mycolicibacterium sp. MU0050]CAJ1586085.1 MCE family protein [Mycolicibacterium sp. MU0050]
MRGNMIGVVWRVTTFLVICSFLTFGLYAVFGQFRFQKENTYAAVFTNASGLKANQFVRVAGVEVGKVKSVVVQPDTTVRVEFTARPVVVLTEGTRAVIRYDDLIGGRFLALEEGAGGTPTIKPGGVIAVANTSPALDLDALIGGFRPLFRALDPEQTNELTGELIKAFEGQADTVGSFLNRVASLTSALADRDQLIGDVVTNLNTVLGSLGDQSTQFAKAIESLSELVSTLSDHRQELSAAVSSSDVAFGAITDLLRQGRPPVTKVVQETDRTSALVVADHEYFDNLLKTLPDAYQMLSRQGLYGDFFSFYLCDLLLKVNGKGGQPVYVKLAGQTTGRCTPK